MTDSGGFIPAPVVTPILTHAMTGRVGGRERKEDRKIERDGPMWRKEKGTREIGKKKIVGRPVLIFLGSETKDTTGGVGGCRSGNGASSICHLSFSLSSCNLFSPSISLFPRLCPAVSGFSWECSEGK